MSLLFVYGTLKSGYCNHHLLGDSVLVSEVCTKAKFRMLDMQDFPGVVMSEPASRISGELFDVDGETLDVIDDLEGKWFFRGEVLLDNGSKAGMYFLSPDVQHERYSVIESGLWSNDDEN
ncbi:gamma-glutamylcyclotransferase [Methanococcoides orientis]|uniref:gamma-glutamylcyclotransferase family protein n=1 Tax=Methanococcoides orientis TaxID=2822137 RepID=UPI001E5AB077|nr:gamma-glutamylcyclotransferase family protein [Methanococcoides orientis]UGV41175.1 gamma-glutamylcyclotransferase [Methanococcoides orientis]